MPTVREKPSVEFVKITDEMRAFNAYAKLRLERMKRHHETFSTGQMAKFVAFPKRARKFNVTLAGCFNVFISNACICLATHVSMQAGNSTPEELATAT
ncbi:hypothetical protein RJ639_003919 [Escallonia herrerae]|uniref:Uncharacterized protein n=1 Tax=Escallonia herrerae TaxID=1293975 RepID=A0AA88W3M7_9ASTE|nr:hypothetical protein RJ639_003919 [Escallonia herrerae]